VKKGYSPKNILSTNGFSNIQKKVFSLTETLTLNEAIVHIKSRGTWNWLKKSQHSLAEENLRKALSKIIKNGKIERQMDLVTVHGKK